MKRKLLLVVAITLLAACAQRHHHTPVHSNIREYQTYDDSTNAIWYWYFLYSDIDKSTPVYYYKSSSPVDEEEYSNVSFTRVVDKQLPTEAEEALQKGEFVKEEPINETQEPKEVQEEIQEEVDTLDAQNDAMTNEGGPAPAESSSGTSTDTGSSGGGGGDSGGGAD